MYLQQRDKPSNVSQKFEVEMWQGRVHIKALHLSLGDAAGQAVLGVVGLISCLIVSSLLFYLLSHLIYVGKGARKERAQSLKRFLSTDLGVYFLCLLISDMGMSLSAIGDLTWSRTYVIRHSSLCNFQGVTNQFGVTGGAFWNLVLAVQTFLILFVRYTPPNWVKWVVVPCGWIFAVLMTIIGPIMNTAPFSFYGPNSSGCWLTFGSSNYKTWFLIVSYLSISSLAIMAVIYILLFLSLSGALERITHRQNSSTGQGSSSGPSGGKASDQLPSSVKRGKQVRAVARKMLWFPLSYATLSIPLVCCTLLGEKGTILKNTVYVVSNTLFCLISVADVTIFVATRRHLLSTPTSHSTHGGGVAMNIVTSTYHDPLQSSSVIVGARPVPYVRPQSPVDSLESEVESYKEGVEKEKRAAEAWESAPPSSKQAKRSSRAERTAWSEGHEDSFGLVNIGGAGARSDDFLTKIDSIDESRSSKVTLAKF